MKKEFTKLSRLIFMLITMAITSTFLPAQVAINTDGTSPNNSAMLDIKSTNKGLLIPRLTTTQRTTLAATAVAGLMVYDTDESKFYFFNGVTWDEGSTGSLWSRSGSVTYLSNYNDGVGIGTLSPAQDLDIVDSTSSAFLIIRSLGGPGYAGIFIDKDQATNNSYIVWQQGSANKWFTGLIKNNDYAISKTHTSADGTFIIKESGNVGIGTTYPGANLEIKNTGDETELRISRSNTTYASKLTFYTGTDYKWRLIAGSGSENLYLSRGSGNTTGNLCLMHNGGNVGIGTSSPLGVLHVHDGVSQNTTVYITSKATNDSSTLFFGEGTSATLGMFWQYDGYYDEMELWGRSGGTDYGPHLLVKRNTGNVAIGGTFASGYKLSVDGKIICEELRVDLSTGWPDYVFGKDYKLMSLKELDTFIQTNGHLPNIPDAEEIQESGLEVGEMQRLMMEKIEELSLYIIQQQKEIEELKKQINKNRN